MEGNCVIPIHIYDELIKQIEHEFKCATREIFNLIDLSLDEKKAEIAKSSIGNTLNRTEAGVYNQVHHYLGKK